jgi:hypothetical protein
MTTTMDSPPRIQPPALWNPNAAACWSLLFSPAFGAFLHARNAEALGREEEAKANQMWFYVSVGYLTVVLVSIFIPAIPEWPFRVVAIGLLLGWYFALGKKQIAHVKETWGDTYERRPWKKPLLIAFGCLLGLFTGSIVFGILRAIASGSPL